MPKKDLKRLRSLEKTRMSKDQPMSQRLFDRFNLSSFDQILISCEHGGYLIPNKWKKEVHIPMKVLQSHRGYDPGALDCANYLAKALNAPAITATVTRLLVDLNRTPNAKTLLSRYMNPLPLQKQQELISSLYTPYWQNAEQFVERVCKLKKQKLLHLSMHSFTPVLRGVRRNGDIGLLYDPKSPLEKKFCDALYARLKKQSASYKEGLVIRKNYPYKGDSDSLVRYLRRKFGVKHYAGIEIEVNQKFAQADEKNSYKTFPIELKQLLLNSLF